MTEAGVNVLREFIQRELDLLRKALDDSRAEQAEDHREVKHRLGNLENGQAAIFKRVSALETHEEAAAARQDGIQSERSRRRRTVGAIVAIVGVAAAVSSVVAYLVFALVDHL